MEEKEKRIRAITRIYYSNPKVQGAILEFAKDRETVPRYFEGFGKRPDVVQYPSDIVGLVKKGATSFHTSEEIWQDPLNIDPEMSVREMNEMRKSWDLLIDVDSKYLDVSKILAKLIVETLENFGVRNYGVKFSGSKGFHVIVSGAAFPEEFDGEKMSDAFPRWPRAICEYLTHITRAEFNKRVGEIFSDSVKVPKDEKAREALCPECGRPTKKGKLVVLECPVCGTQIQRKDMKITKRRLKCIQENCAGVLEIVQEKDYFECEYCDDVSSISKTETSGKYATTFTAHAKKNYSEEIEEGDSGNYYGASDLVLVSPRHLFRMPYSLHEKTALASVVLTKEEIDNFKPRDADPLKVEVKNFYPENERGEGSRLLAAALEWKQEREAKEKEIEKKKYSGREFKETDYSEVDESMFPVAIKKLLKGLDEGRKRGLFVLITFLRSLNFSPSEINKRIRDWNEKNDPPLKEGYVRSQIEWHLRQKRKILPPNYANDAFYRDIGLIKEKPKTKNPLVDVKRELWKRKN